MAEQINALLVHTQDETYRQLEQVLRSLNIRVIHTRNCREASLHLKPQGGGIDLVFGGESARRRMGKSSGISAAGEELPTGHRGFTNG